MLYCRTVTYAAPRFHPRLESITAAHAVNPCVTYAPPRGKLFHRRVGSLRWGSAISATRIRPPASLPPPTVRRTAPASSVRPLSTPWLPSNLSSTTSPKNSWKMRRGPPTGPLTMNASPAQFARNLSGASSTCTTAGAAARASAMTAPRQGSPCRCVAGSIPWGCATTVTICELAFLLRFLYEVIDFYTVSVSFI